MSKPVLVVDFDDVCVDFVGAWHVFHAKRWSVPEIAYASTSMYDLAKLHGISEQEKNDRIMAFWQSSDHDLIQDFPDAVAGLEILAFRYELHMATARSEEIRPQTARLVDRYFSGMFVDMHFTGQYHAEEGKRRTKAGICNELEAVALIDDGFHNLIDLVDTECTLLMPDRPWNQDKDHPRIIRTFGWAQILSKL